MPAKRVIKKYPNRRLYDTVASRYITLADVQRLIGERIDFEVVDSQSGADLTRNILIQVIAERELGPHPLFTTELLTRLIRFDDREERAALASFLEDSVRTFAKHT